MFSRPEVDSKTIGYGSYDQAFNNLESAFKPGPFVLGNQFSAADVYIASQLSWGMGVKAVEKKIVFENYVSYCKTRPAFKRYTEQSKKMIQELENRKG
jgi:glutathione S-transferase